MSEEVLYRTDDGVALVTLNRPESLNAMTVGLLEQLLARVTEAAEDPRWDAWCSPAPAVAFCADGDVKDQAQRAGPPDAKRSPPPLEARIAQLRKFADISRLLFEMPKPTIAMLNGVAAGAGMSLALACDMRMAGQSARMTTAFAKVGMAGDLGGTYFLNRLVGPARARELYFHLRRSSARASWRQLGPGQRALSPTKALEAECMALAGKLAGGPANRLGLYRSATSRSAEQGDQSRLLDVESDGMIRTGQSEDHREAFAPSSKNASRSFRAAERFRSPSHGLPALAADLPRSPDDP